MQQTLTVALCVAAALTGCKPTPAPAPVSSSAQAKPAVNPAAEPAPVSAKTVEAAAAPNKMADREKIEALLTKLEGSSDRFNRNGTEYSGKEAAAHLRSKLSSAGGRVKTVREFIDGLASTSSMSGKPYTVKRADGTTVNAKEWFDAALAQLEKPGAP
jgi:hypothetical protein